MTMKIQNLFPPVELDSKFREQLKLEILAVSHRQRQARFNWQWLVAPGVALASLLLVVLLGKGQPVAQIPRIRQPNQPGLTQLWLPTQNSRQAQKDEDSQSPQPTATAQNLDQLAQELDELANTLDTDADLEAAIAFNSL